jgi:hypothetical protein
VGLAYLHEAVLQWDVKRSTAGCRAAWEAWGRSGRSCDWMVLLKLLGAEMLCERVREGRCVVYSGGVEIVWIFNLRV